MKRRWTTWRIPFLCAVMLVCVAGIVLRAPQALPAGVYATPTPQPTPYVAPATPTPAPTPVPGAITIVENGAAVCTLAGEEDAAALLAWQLGRAGEQIPAAEELQLVEFVETVLQRDALIGESPLALEEAQALLRQDKQLLRTSITTRRVETEVLPFETEQAEDRRIPYGARIVVQVGRTGRHSIHTTRTYMGGITVGAPIVEENTLEPVAESILVGTYVAETPDGTPGRNEGQRGRAGPEGFPLSLPVDGSIRSNFGTRERVMHYGVDISADVGDAVSSPGEGIVLFAGVRGSYGFVVEIAHGDGFVSRLAPLRDVAVAAGDEVVGEQLLGNLAAPVDEEKEPHLHMELLIDGIPYNPRQYLS